MEDSSQKVRLSLCLVEKKQTNPGKQFSLLQGDVGSSGPPGPIGETGHGLPGPKVMH